TVRAFALEGSTTSSVSGDGGADFVEYVVNAPLSIAGGDGTDTVRVIGTEFADQIVVTSNGVFGAGVNVSYAEIEILEIDAAEGNDSFFVLSTDPTVETRLFGGLGSDRFIVGGDVPQILSGNAELFPATAGPHKLDDIGDQLLKIDGSG